MTRRTIVFAGILALMAGPLVFGASTGTTNLITQQGSGAAGQFGDFTSNSGNLNTFYSYFIEVPPGLGRLEVDLFDADIGLGGAGEAAAGRDRARTGFDPTVVVYTLRDPSGVIRATLTGDDTQPAGSDNAWLDFYDSRVPTFRSLATATTTGNTTLTIATPAGTAQNDLLILILSKDGSGAVNTPAGWTLVNEGACSGNACRLGVFRLVQGAVVPANYTVTWTGTEEAVGAILAYTGVDTTTPIDVSGSATGDNTAPTAPSVTTTVANTRVVRIYGADDDISGTPYPASHTGRFNLDANNTIVAGAADAAQLTAGGTGTAVFALAASDQWRAVTLALRPAVTPPAPQNGHWELRADMSDAVTIGNDINALGVRGHDGTAGAGGTELNVYQHSYAAYGVNSATSTRSYTQYPYVTSGCSFDSNTFDWDSSSGATGSTVYTSRTAAFSQTIGTLSINNSWSNDVVTGWTTDQNATDYGVWPLGVTINGYPGNANYGDLYIGSFAAANPPPTTQPQANTFRIYLPTDGGAAPTKPYLEQLLRHSGSGGNNGPNPPQVGVQSIFTVTVRLVNPTTQPITFSAANLVTANIPGGGAVYGGTPQVSQGAIVSQPAVGGTGNITWNPGTVSAGATALLAYLVQITPTSAGQRIPATATPASGNATRAQFVDETQNTTQARATYLAGPLCELAVTQNVVTPVVVSGFRTLDTSAGVVVEWDTASEAGAAGFELYRKDASGWTRVGRALVPALQGAPQGGRYHVVDHDASPFERQTYVLREIETRQPGRIYGPFDVAPGASRGAASAGSNGDTRRAKRPTAAMLGSLKTHRATAAAERAARGRVSALKLGVRERGLYFVPAETIAAQLGLGADRLRQLLATGGLALSNRQQPVAWRRAKGPEGLLFYGEPVESIYARDNVYWLRVGNGLLMGATSAGPTGPGGDSFVDTVLAEQDHLAATVVSTDPESDYWYWDFLIAGDATSGRKSFAVAAPRATRIGTARLRIDLQGATDSGTENEHHAVVRVNGVTVGEDHWTGIAPRSLQADFSAGVLLDGTNSVEVEARLDGGAPYSIFYVDGFTLEYARRFEADAGALVLRGDDNVSVTVGGFADAGVLVLDLTNPLQPRRVRSVRVFGAAPDFQASFGPASAETPYLAASQAGWKSPSFVIGDRASRLKKASNGADLVIITTRDLIDAARRLADVHAARGLSSAVVDVEDVMDEFADGILTPHALVAFLETAARRWSPAPRYVVLAGKGSFDYKDNQGLGGNLVPPLMLGTPHGLFASDIALGDIAGGDGVPELAVGRVPVLTADELVAYADKVAAYESDPDQTGRALFVADAMDGGTDFAAASEAIAAKLPAGFDTARIYYTGGDAGPARAELRARLDAGLDLVNYTGHGALDRLSAAGLLHSGDVLSLTNPRAPLVTALTCVINRFEVPGFESLGEALVKKAGGGAAAVWAPTGLSVNDEATLLGRLFYHDLAEHPGERLGDAIVHAMAAYGSGGDASWLPGIYALLGDPALSVKTAPAPEPGGGGGDPGPTQE